MAAARLIVTFLHVNISEIVAAIYAANLRVCEDQGAVQGREARPRPPDVLVSADTF